MKKIEATIGPLELDRVYDALRGDHVRGITVSEVKTSLTAPRTAQFRGRKYPVNFAPRLKIEVLTEDHHVAQVMATIRLLIRAAPDSDESILIVPVTGVVRVRTGERGSAAI